MQLDRRSVMALLAAIGFARPSVAATSTARPGATVRLGGYFYVGDPSDAWFAENFDLLVLLTQTDPSVARKLKSVNPGIRLYQYLLADEVQFQPGKAQAPLVSSSDAARFQLHDRQGQAISSPRGPNYALVDFSNPAWASYVGAYVRRMLQNSQSDGITFDEVPLAKTDAWVTKAAAFDRDEDVQDAFRNFLLAFRKASNAPVLINAGALHHRRSDGRLLWQSMGDAIDGAWHEGWIRYYLEHASPHQAQVWEADISSAEQFSAAGKTYIASCAFRNRDELEYAIGCYLLAKNSESLVLQPMFAYDDATRGGFNAKVARQQVEQNQDLFNVDFGKPLGPRALVDGVWRREYEKGVVTVNAAPSQMQFTDRARGGGTRPLRADKRESGQLPAFSATLSHRG